MDKLVRQLLGRYKKNRINITTVVNHYIADPNLSSKDIKRLVHENMRQGIAKEIIDSDLLVISEMPPTFNLIGTEYSGQCYCFSRHQLLQLIDDAFNAGKEARDDED